MEQAAEPEAPKNLGEHGAEPLESRPSIRVSLPQRRVVDWQSPPRLSLQCLLLWVAGAAAAMAAVRRLNPAEPGAIGLLLVSGYAAGCGAAWTGLGLWIARAVRGASWPVEPGHWLLVAAGVRLALDLAIGLWFANLFTAPLAALDAATCCCFVLPLLSRSLSAAWKAGFVILCALEAWPLAVVVVENGFWPWPPAWLEDSAAWVGQRRPVLVALTALVFALVDWRAWRQRTWLHWTGLGVVLWLALLAALPR